jgi:voltage-gated potassium channel Kch
VLQSLSEKGQLSTQAGTNAFSVLLFQDIAVIPILALFPLLATFAVAGDDHGHGANLIAHFPVWGQVLISCLMIAVIVLLGRFLSAPAFGIIAETRIRELFTAFALLIVIAISVAMSAIGLSAALGTFLAGVVLAESEFRHELEADIEPFKGLLLGLFFITVGASINFQILADNTGLILGLVFALIVIKALVLYALAKLFRMESKQGLLFVVALAQGGEFAFVLSSAGLQSGVFETQVASILTLVVAISMVIAPLLFVAYEVWFSRTDQTASYEDDETMMPTTDVIVAGYGRFGQIVGRLLISHGYHLTILDHSPSQIDLMRRFGNTVYYGDPSRRDLLEAAGAHQAKLLVVSVDDTEKAIEIIETAQKHFPNLKILARAIDRRHAYKMIEKEIHFFRRETFDSAITLGKNALLTLGEDAKKVDRAAQLFAKHDEDSLYKLAKVWGDEKSYGAAVRQRLDDLKQVLQEDQEFQEETQKRSDGD